MYMQEERKRQEPQSMKATDDTYLKLKKFKFQNITSSYYN